MAEYQHRYGEKVFKPVPGEFSKISGRLGHWVSRTKAESDKMHNSTNPRVTSWRQDILNIRATDNLDLIRQINVITNKAVTYVDDYKQYKKDYWAPPYATLTRGGDCEDIALLKAVALYMRGFDVYHDAHLMIGAIWLNGRKQAHAVLAVDIGGQSYVMGSLHNEVAAFDRAETVMTPLYMVDTRQIVVFSPAYDLNSYAPAAGQAVTYKGADGMSFAVPDGDATE